MSVTHNIIQLNYCYINYVLIIYIPKASATLLTAGFFPSLISAASIAKKKAAANIMKGRRTRIQEIAVNPFLHNQLRIQAQITTKKPLTIRVRSLKFCTKVIISPSTAKTKYSWAGVQYLPNSN